MSACVCTMEHHVPQLTNFPPVNVQFQLYQVNNFSLKFSHLKISLNSVFKNQLLLIATNRVSLSMTYKHYSSCDSLWKRKPCISEQSLKCVCLTCIDMDSHLYAFTPPWLDASVYLNLLYVFFWVIPRRLNFICRRFGTLCLFHLHKQVGKYLNLTTAHIKNPTRCNSVSELISYLNEAQHVSGDTPPIIKSLKLR
jgi:hypothetical protein